ncbi:hypothetical protein [Actinomyces vulturis]|uniref:hypothetical protein n=1 Tax=Actinomyces vulturis TaxID=1857645 RepID=UPI00082A9962|nr:hypothetical protein [Actinomyces vulturis]
MKFSTPAFLVTVAMAAATVITGLALGWALLDVLTIAALIVIVPLPALGIALRPTAPPTWPDDDEPSAGSCRRTIAVVSQELQRDSYGQVTSRMLRDLPDAPRSSKSSDIIAYIHRLSASSQGKQS